MSEATASGVGQEVQGLRARWASLDERVILVGLISIIFAILVLPPLFFLLKGALTITHQGETHTRNILFAILTVAYENLRHCLGSYNLFYT